MIDDTISPVRRAAFRDRYNDAVENHFEKFVFDNVVYSLDEARDLIAAWSGTRPQTKLVCTYCKGSSLGQDAWIDPNTRKIVRTYDSYYCFTCDGETTVEEAAT